MRPADQGAASPARGLDVRLRDAVGVARRMTARAGEVEDALLSGLAAVASELSAAAGESRRTLAMLSATYRGMAAPRARVPRAFAAPAEAAVLDAAERVGDAAAALGGAAADVSTGFGELVANRATLARGFRRAPELRARMDRARSSLGRSFRASAVHAMAGRLRRCGMVMVAFGRGGRTLDALRTRLAEAAGPLSDASRGREFLTDRATVLPAAAGEREILLRADAGGELVLSWGRGDHPAVRVSPTPGRRWAAVRDAWARCFDLPQDEPDGRRLAVVRPATAEWAGPGAARLIRRGVLAWEARPATSRGS